MSHSINTARRRPEFTAPPPSSPRPTAASSTAAPAARAEGPAAYTARTEGPRGIGTETARANSGPDRDFEGEIGAALPASTAEATVRERGGRIVLDASDGNDRINVSKRADGGVRVSVNGTNHDFDADQARRLTIRAGDGDDRVNVDMRVNVGIRIEGGDGNDTLRGGSGNDTLVGGAGNDYMEGGAGNDAMVGGSGRDVMYGLDGNDRMDGGDGRDYLDGGNGNDRLGGGAGVDQLMGGRGNDDLRGGDGDDVLAGGHGVDAFNGDGGADRIYREGSEWSARDASDTRTDVDMSGTDPGRNVSVNGDARFTNRVQSDLDAMRSVPSGRALLNDIDNSGRNTTISETGGGNATNYTHASRRLMNGDNTANGIGTDAQVSYNTTRTELSGGHAWSHRPPVVGLQHELVHAENAANGAMPRGLTDGDKNRERIAVGLPIDQDNDASTPRIQPNRHTENGFRSDLNLERRAQY